MRLPTASPAPPVLIVLACACALLAARAIPTAPAETAGRSVRAAAPGGIECAFDLQHPLAARVTALNPVRRGADVRLRVEATSLIPLERGRVRLLDAGPAVVLGSREADLGRMLPDRTASSEFTVRLPADGARALVQFRVEGTGPEGDLHRGAAFNLLPDGPALPSQVVPDASGRMIAEYPARRIAR